MRVIDRADGLQVWRHAPATRTIFHTRQGLVRLAFPWVVTWWWTRNDPVGVGRKYPRIYLSMTEPRLDASDLFFSPPLPNALSFGRFCMGTASHMKFAAPLDALLFSSFGGEDVKPNVSFDQWVALTR